MPDSIQVFKMILASDRGSTLAIFDLDSTIFNVSHRTQKIFEAFVQQSSIQVTYPEAAAALAVADVHHTEWGIRETLERHGIKAPEAFYKSLLQFWKKSFFSNHFLHHDRPFDGAIEYLQALSKAGVPIKYLTGRDEKNMRSGTMQSFAQWGVPLKSEQDLIMKPTKGAQIDEDFKRDQILLLNSGKSRIWFFENEPAIINAVEKAMPHIQIVWINTTHSRRAPNPTHLPIIQTTWKTD